MKLSDYLVELEATKTYASGLIRYEEYIVKYSLFGGPRAVLPHADKEKHVIVMQFFGNEPVLSCILTDKDPEMRNRPKTSDSNKLLFIFVNMKPRTLKIDSPPDGYRLEDGDHVYVSLNINYLISDAEEFWMQSNDPLARFEDEVVDQATNYFLHKSSEHLITIPSHIKNTMESEYRKDADIKEIKEYLQGDISEKFSMKGIEIISVYANIKLSETIEELLQRRRGRIFGGGGVIDAEYDEEEKYKKERIKEEYLLRKTSERIKRRDEMIENCTEFKPYGLIEVIRILDMRLLGNFDNMPWNEAIQIVREELEKRRASYHDTEIEKIRKNLRTAIEDGIDPHDIKMLKDQLGEVLLKKEEAERGLFSSSQFLKLAISQESREQIPNSSGYISSHIIS
uniref:hypothetical protein n=1 Tax=Candidatus Electronema sp. TaxID=2698783 RepID=UPI004056A9D6